MSVARRHAEWLSLLETSGPFLFLPILLRVFPQGLDERNPAKACELREAYQTIRRPPSLGSACCSNSCWTIRPSPSPKARPSRPAWRQFDERA